MGCACCSHTSSEQKTLRVVIFGLENSGKSSLVRCLKTSKSIAEGSRYLSTHGVLAINAQLTSQTTMDLLLFDCGGCKHQRHMWPHLSNDPDLILFVVDRIDSICVTDAKDALFDLLTDESLLEKPLLIVLTKSDQQVNTDTRQLEEQLDLSSIKVSVSSRRVLTDFQPSRIDRFTECPSRPSPSKGGLPS